MNRFTKIVVLGMVVALLGALALPMVAQDGAGEGGTIVASNIGDDPATFNPIIGSDTTSSTIYGRIYPALIALDPVTLEPTPGAPGGLAIAWEYDETGTILTVSLRQDAFWGDGTQITANDYIWALNATRSNLTSSPRTYVFYKLDDGTETGGAIHNVVALDDFTLQFTLGDVNTDENGEVIVDADGNPVLAPNCDALNTLSDVAVVPSHAYEAAFGMDYAAMDADPYFLPESEAGLATFGVWTQPFVEFGVQVSLLADQNYPDTVLGYVSPAEYLLLQVEDTTVEYERFLAGDFASIAVSPNFQNGLRGDERFQFIEYPSNGYTYMGLNLADPNNPVPGRDENGLVEQGLHPIFGDKLVRQALAYAIDVRTMIGTRPEGDNPATGILEGNGYPIAVHNHPGLSWVDPGLEPYPFDPARAAELLEEAGWVDTDGDGVRNCQGCLYAREVDAAYEGSPMEFELLTNSGNRLREATGATIREQLGAVGITVNFQAIEFGTLVDELTGQAFDAIIIGWSLGIPFTPGDLRTTFFGTGADLPGAGFNFTSYANLEMEDLVKLADTLPAAEDGSYASCDPAAREALYNQALNMLYEDLPYIWLYAGNTMIAAQGNLGNFDPLPYNASWNEDAWTVGE